MAEAAERFLVTGGQGFIGAWIVRALLDEAVPVTVLDRTPDNGILSQVVEPERLPGIERVFGDIAESGTVERALEEHGITHVIHLAGLQVPACRRDPVLGARVNVIGTLNVFEAVRRSGGRVRSIVYASSAAVAGDPGDYEGPIPDDASHVPRTHYGVFKAANEGNARVHFLDHGISSVGLRPYTVYGVGREIGITSGPTKAIKAAVLGRSFAIPFTGRSSFVFVEDLARIFIGAARAEAAGALALNIRGTIDTVERFIALLEEAIPECRGRISCRGEPIPVAWNVDEKGLESLLGGAVPRTSLEDGIRRTAAHFRALGRSGRLHDRDLAG